MTAVTMTKDETIRLQAAEIERFKTDYALLTDSYREVVSDAFRLSEEAEQARQENERLREDIAVSERVTGKLMEEREQLGHEIKQLRKRIQND